MVLFLLEFDQLQLNLIGTHLLSLYLLLPLQFPQKLLRVICLVINLLVCALFLNPSQVDDVLADADPDCHRFLKVGLHLTELAIVENGLLVYLFLLVVLLFLEASRPLDCEVFQLGTIRLINLVSYLSVLVREVLNKLIFGSLSDQLHACHHRLSRLVVPVHRKRQSLLVQLLATDRVCLN